ncbi:hypothetical protein ACFOTA_14970 [Chitinophaga sp. GCM10012297]|uniref:DUF4843 domain-containing protein n=1 Tax=Chitinophaga chungangae TaxID=2821488 RepID=A0ABS3YFR6_9BACT|nr:hypothetical protein [Chitinophaga chungangae]MBO9153521.1 hypothetical protein [Chitinophaga chungangae]
MKATHILLVLLLLTTAACRKEGEFLYKGDMMPFTISGFNAGNQYLRVQVDTFRQLFRIGNGPFAVSQAFTFPEGQKTVKMSVTDEESGKKVLEREWKKEDGAAKVNFFYLDGVASEMPEPPAPEAGKIKLIYMWNPVMTKYDGAVDIAVGKLYFTPKVFQELARVKNVKPGQFSETITIEPFPTTGQTYNGQPTPVLLVVYLYKAGTNEFYTAGTGYNWNISTSAPKPPASVASSKLYIFSENPSGSLMAFVKNLEL